MSKSVSLKKNIAFQTAYQLLNTCLPLITAPYLARVLGASQLGVFSYTSSVVAYFVLFAMLGTVNYATRTISSVKNDKIKLSSTFWSIYYFQSTFTFLFLMLYLFYLCFFCSENRFIATIQTIALIDCFFNINWFFFGVEKFQLTVTRSFFVRVITVLAILLFVKEANDLWLYTLIMMLSSSISNLILWFYLFEHIEFVHVEFKDIIQHLKPNLLVFIPLLAMSIYHQMDKTMLGLFSNYVQTGLYYNADKVVNVPVGVISGVSVVMLPRIASLLSLGKKLESDNLFKLSIEGVVAISVALCFGISSIAKEFVPVFFGSGFEECALLIMVLSPVLIIKGFSITLRNQFLIPYKLERIFIISVSLGAFVNLLVNLILIPIMGALGAVFGTLLAELMACLIQFWLIKRYISLGQFYKRFIIYLTIGGIMFCSVRLVAMLTTENLIKLFIEIATGGLVYIVLCIFYWKYTKNILYGEFCSAFLNRLQFYNK